MKVGELVKIQQHHSALTTTLSALVRLRPSTSFSMVIDLSIGMRCYPVVLTDRIYAIPIFNQKAHLESSSSLLGIECSLRGYEDH